MLIKINRASFLTAESAGCAVHTNIVIMDSISIAHVPQVRAVIRWPRAMQPFGRKEWRHNSAVPVSILLRV